MGQVIDALNNQTQTNLDDLNLNLDGGLDCNVDEVKSINQTNEKKSYYVFHSLQIHQFSIIFR